MCATPVTFFPSLTKEKGNTVYALVVAVGSPSAMGEGANVRPASRSMEYFSNGFSRTLLSGLINAGRLFENTSQPATPAAATPKSSGTIIDHRLIILR
jgi:hypothetical protein